MVKRKKNCKKMHGDGFEDWVKSAVKKNPKIVKAVKKQAVKIAKKNPKILNKGKKHLTKKQQDDIQAYMEGQGFFGDAWRWTKKAAKSVNRFAKKNKVVSRGLALAGSSGLAGPYSAKLLLASKGAKTLGYGNYSANPATMTREKKGVFPNPREKFSSPTINEAIQSLDTPTLTIV